LRARYAPLKPVGKALFGMMVDFKNRLPVVLRISSRWVDVIRCRTMLSGVWSSRP